MFTCSAANAASVHVSALLYACLVFADALLHIPVSAGQAVVPYMGPRPMVGIHRYVLVVFQHKAPLTPPPALAPGSDGARVRFTTRAFANRHQLGLPVAAMYFNAQKEPANRRRNYY